jgi:ABC-type transport system involved in cytochrome c biogenesis permease component
MLSRTQTSPVSNSMIWTGRVISALIVLLLLCDDIIKFVKPAPAIEAFGHLGLPVSLSIDLGILLLVCTVVYAIPRTSLLGAILLTGYLGGAVAIHMRAGDPLLSHVLFPVYLGVLVWTGLALRDARIHALMSF